MRMKGITKDTILYLILFLIVILLAFLFLNYVFNFDPSKLIPV
jgi:hypothetical protein